VPGIATAAIPYCQIAINHQRTIFYWLDSNFASIVVIARTSLADSAVVGEPLLLV
jgi:hypothetical protein